MGKRWANVGPTLDQSPIQMLGQRWANVGPTLDQAPIGMLGQRWANDVQSTKNSSKFSLVYTLY